jgi:hypothetical protein
VSGAGSPVRWRIAAIGRRIAASGTVRPQARARSGGSS